MSQKERGRELILSGVAEGKFRLVDAGKKLGVSYRQVKRLYQRYRHAVTDGVDAPVISVVVDELADVCISHFP